MENFQVCLDDLPPVPRLIAELVGIEKCCKILEMYGGSRLHFSSHGFPPDHEIRTFLDDEDCRLLSKFFDGTVSIPVAKSAYKIARDRLIWRDSELGCSSRELSRKYAICERQVQNAVNSYFGRLRSISDSRCLTA